MSFAFAPWRSEDAGLAVILVVVVLIGVGVATVGGRPARVLLVAPVMLALVLGGFAVQRHYLKNRYTVGAGLKLDRADEIISRREPTRVVPFNTVQFYPFFGPSFANEVLVLDPPAVSSRSSEAPVRCREWQRLLRANDPAFVVYADGGVPVERPARAWVVGSPSLRVIARDSGSVVAAVTEPLRLNCP